MGKLVDFTEWDTLWMWKHYLKYKKRKRKIQTEKLKSS